MRYYVSKEILAKIAIKPHLLSFVKAALYPGYGQIFISGVCEDDSHFGDTRRSLIERDALRSGMSAADVEIEQ